MASEWGFVYFLGNESMPGMYKIGFTTKHPRLRMAELASASGCPTPFTLLAYFGTKNPQSVESSLHMQFAKYRVNGSREFFRVSVSDLADSLDYFFGKYGDSIYRCEIDKLVYECIGINKEKIIIEIKEPKITEEESERNRALCKERIANLKTILKSRK